MTMTMTTTKKTRQELIDAYLAEPLIKDDLIYVGDNRNGKVIKVDGDTVTYKGQYGAETAKISEVKKYTGNIGYQPFVKDTVDIKTFLYDLDGTLHVLGMKKHGNEKPYMINGHPIIGCNFNPFIYDKNGEKIYYQRPLVWSLSDKQLLIESIYHGVYCGKVLTRRRSFETLEELAEKGETVLSLHDIVDGKQRLNAIAEFINGEFSDLSGNYFEDFSKSAKNEFMRGQLLSYFEMAESTTDKDVVNQFLKLNFSGVQQSMEHLQWLKSINL